MSPTTKFSIRWFLLEFGAEDGVHAAEDEGGGDQADVDEISHEFSPWII